MASITRLRRIRLTLVALLTVTLVFGAAPPPAPTDGFHLPKLDFSSPLHAAGSALAAGPKLLAEGLKTAVGWLGGLGGPRHAEATVLPPAAPNPTAPEEVPTLRSRDAKHFRNPDGTLTAEFGHGLHFEVAPGQWEDVDLNFRPVGSDYVADRNDVIVRVSAQGVEAFERKTGRGIRWLTPVRPAVSGRTATVSWQGLSWRYTTRRSGIKLEATVSAPLGARTFEFPYQALGAAGALTVDAEGNLVTPVFRVPRAIITGADGIQRLAGSWRQLSGGRVAFDLDDSAFPPEAYPYVLDPTTTFNVAAGADDAYVRAGEATYPPNANKQADSSGEWLYTARDRCTAGCPLSGQTYEIASAFMRWDTSSLPNDATVSGATLRANVATKVNDNARNLTAEWYSAWPIDTVDYGIAEGDNDVLNVPLANVTAGNVDNDFALGGSATAVSLTGYTGLRLDVTGGQPTGRNALSFAALEHATYAEPRLLVTYTSAAPTINVVTDSPDPAVVGDPIAFSVGWNDAGGSGRAVICQTDWIEDGACVEGTWAVGSFSNASPAIATYATTPTVLGRYDYYAFACDASGACSAPVQGTFEIQPVAITRRQETSSARGSAGTSHSVSWLAPTIGGNLLLLAATVRWSTEQGNIGPPAGWSTAALANNGNAISTALFYKAGAPTQSGAVTVSTGNESATEIILALAEYAGVAASLPLDRTASTSGSSTTASSGTTATTTQANELWIGVLGNVSAADQQTPTNGFTQLSRPQTGAGAQGLYEKSITAAGQASVQASLNFSTPWSGVVATFKATEPEDPPTPQAPSDGAQVATYAPTLQVVNQGAGTTYRFTVTAAGTPIATSPWLATPSWTVPVGVLGGGGEYGWYALAREGGASSVASPTRKFKTDAQQLGARGYYPMGSFALGGGVGGAVNVATGNLTVSQADVSLPTVADPFVVSRTYNSRGAGKQVLVDDSLPFGATAVGWDPDEGGTVTGSSAWVWDATRKWSGTQSHKEPAATGIHQHYFENAQNYLFIPQGATIVTYAYLDPASTPREVMLQFYAADGSGWEHRAYWGQNQIIWGTDQTASRRSMGALPATGQWVRLEIPASKVGLEGKAINGVSYTLLDGGAWFDKTYLGAGPAGYGWTAGTNLVLSELSFAKLIEHTANPHLELVDSDGGGHFYYPTATPNLYSSDYGDFATAIKNTAASEWDVKEAGGLHYFFDAINGRLKRVELPERTDKPGFAYTYDTSGRLSVIKDPIDRQLSLDYDTDGRLWRVKADFDGSRTLATYEYDADEQLRAVVDAAGNRTEYTYDPATHDLLSVTTPQGTATGTVGDFQTRFDYQAPVAGEEHRRITAIRRSHTEGANTTEYVTSFAYTPSSRTTKVTSPRGSATPSDPNDFVTTVEYNAQGNPTKVTDTAGNFTTTVWNDKNLRTSVTDREGKTTTFEYDGRGNLCKEILPVTNKAGQPAVTQYFYDEFVSGFTYTCATGTKPTYNLRTRTVDAEGAVSKVDYLDPAAGKPWITKEIAGDGTPEATTTCYTYYENTAEPWRYGKLRTKTMPKGAGSGCASADPAYTTTYDYWAPGDTYSFPGEISLQNVPQQGWPKLTSRPGDTPVTCAGSSASACHHYDYRGNQIHALDAKGDEYEVLDLLDRVIKSQALGSTGVPDPAKWVTTTYDADGNITRVIDPDLTNDQTASAYDDLNRLSGATDAWGTTTTYAYDENSNLKTKTTPGIGATSYAYDGLDRLSSLTDPQNGVMTYAAYDKEGRLLEKRLPNTTHIDYVYNAAGWLTALRNRKGASHGATEFAIADSSYRHDGTGQIWEEVLPGHLTSSDSKTGSVSATGAPAEWGFLASAQGPISATLDWSSTSRSFSFANQSIPAEPLGGTSTSNHTIEASAPGTISATLDWTDVLVNLDLRLYNPSGSLIASATSLTAKPETLSYTVPAGSTGTYRLEVTNESPTATTYTLSGSSQVYANLDLELLNPSGTKVAEAKATGSTHPETLSYQVPASTTGTYTLKVIAASDSATYTLSWSFPVENRRTYGYDALGRLTSVTEGSTTRSYEFDPDSNRTALKTNGALTKSYTYNALDQLLQVAGPEGTETFTYNTAGELTTHLRPGYLLRSDAKNGSVSTGGTPTQSWSFDATAQGPVSASLDWSPITKSASWANEPIAAGPATKSHSVVASAPGTISGTLTWQTASIPVSQSGSLSGLGTASALEFLHRVAAGGTISLSLDWPATVGNFDLELYNPSGTRVACACSLTDKPETITYAVPAGASGTYEVRIRNMGATTESFSLSGSYTGYPDLDLKLFNPSGQQVACSCSTTATTESLPYAVPAGSTGSYRFDVVNHTNAATTYSLSASYPAYADLDLELLDPSGTKVAEAKTPGPVRPETLSHTVPAGATGTYTLKVIAASDNANYTLSFSFPVENKRTYTYDKHGLPVAEDNNLASETSVLDALDRVIRRTKRDWKGTVTSDLKFGYEGGGDSRISESDAATGALNASYLADPGGLLSSRVAGTTTYSYFNGHGDLVQKADLAGVTTYASALAWDEFGNPQGGGATPYGFTGRQQRDTSALTGVIRMGVRLYDPVLGRFLSRDPVEAGDFNEYLYAGADPLNNYDLDGHAKIAVTAAGGGKTKKNAGQPVKKKSFWQKAVGVVKKVGKAARYVYRHVNVSAGGCLVYCFQLSFAHGRLYGSAGGFGLLARGIGVGWTSAQPERMEGWSGQGCGAFVVGGCFSGGGRTGGRGSWFGASFTTGFGFQVGGMYTRRLL